MKNISEIEERPVNPEPIEVEDHAYTGQATTKAGEPIYFRMELITEKNKPYWEQYKQQSFTMAAYDGPSILRYLIIKSQKVIEADGSIRYVYNGDPEITKQTGFTQKELNEFINYLGNQGYIEVGLKVKNKKKETLLASSVGSNHIHLNAHGHQYVIYASKTPEFSILSTKPYVYGDNLTLKEYMAQYNNLLMCVGSDFSKEAFFHNRGIFRNPMSVIENTHKQISMLLHAFSGAVAQKYFPEKNEMHVLPVGSMRLIMYQSLKAADLMITESTLEEVLSNTRMDDPQDQWDSVRVNALANYYSTFGPSPMQKDEQPHGERLESARATTQSAKSKVHDIRDLAQEAESPLTPKLGAAPDDS